MNEGERNALSGCLGSAVALVLAAGLLLWGLVWLGGQVHEKHETHALSPCWGVDMSYYLDKRTGLCFAGCFAGSSPVRFQIECTPAVLRLTGTSTRNP